jgi:hypothetical protein
MVIPLGVHTYLQHTRERSSSDPFIDDGDVAEMEKIYSTMKERLAAGELKEYSQGN